MEKVLIFLPVCFGLYFALTGLVPKISPGVEKAVGSRAGKKETLTHRLTASLAVRLLPLITLEDIKRQSLAQILRTIGEEDNPELFEARAWATGTLYALCVLLVSPLFHVFLLVLFPGSIKAESVYQVFLLLAVILLFVGRHMVEKELDKKVKERKKAIEWELPQFAGTVLQCLAHTKNVIEILETYRKICSPALKREIDQALNDMRTGNHENAIRNLAGRVNSGAFTQLAQGLIGLLRGEDQTSYFQIISKDFSKAQHEQIRKELLARPEKLTINNILLLVGMMLMLFAAIGGYLMDTGAGLF